MMKGVRRRLVVLKTTGDPHFEEAYFVLREEAAGEAFDVVSAAERVIRDNRLDGDRPGGRETRIRLFFALGGLILGFGAAMLLFL